MLVVTDNKIPDDCRNYFISAGHTVISLPSYKALPRPVNAHPDMLYFILGDCLFTYKDYYDIAENEFSAIQKALDIKIILSDEYCGNLYPDDVKFNALYLGNTLYCNTSHVSQLLLRFAKERGIKTVDVKQGYAKCSVCVIDNNSVITSDRGMASILKENGVDVLLIRQGYIELPGYDAGFIGGASGKYLNNIYFCGDLNTHPDVRNISMFCNAHGKYAVSTGHNSLYDVGTMFFY